MLPPRFPHQEDALNRALRLGGSLCLFHEPGLGKTRTCLDLFTHLCVTTPALKLLVLCPLSIIEAAWGADIARFTDLPWVNLRQDAWTTEPIGVLNYEAFLRRTTAWPQPLMLVVDESARLRDPKSLTTKAVLRLAERCQVRMCLSGTPAPNGLHELYSQAKVVDPNSVPRSFFTWRRDWFYLGRGTRMMAEPPPSRDAMRTLFQHGWEWKITDVKRDQLLARLAPITSWVRKADALDLPEKTYVMRHVTLSPAEHQAYESMRRELVVEFAKETVTAEIALTKLMKLRQLSSGFCYGQQGTHRTGESRLRLLLEVLEELGSQPVIIWANFREEIEQISNTLGDRAVTLYSGTADRTKSLAQFGREAQYLIAHPRSAGHGLTLTQASAAIWFSLDFSLEAYTQANDRIHRIGQSKPCLYVHLIAPGRIDAYIWKVLRDKWSLQEAIDAALGGRAAARGAASHQEAMAASVGAGGAA